MTKLKKGLMAAAAIATIGVAGVATTAGVYAATTDSTDPQASLVQKIADKFGVNKDEVQQLFDEQRTEHEAKHEAEVAERLQALVDDGTITAEQKTLIETKIKEMKEQREADRDNFKELSHEERKAKMDEGKTGLESWAKDNGLDLTKLKGVFMDGGPRGFGGPGHGPEAKQ